MQQKMIVALAAAVILVVAGLAYVNGQKPHGDITIVGEIRYTAEGTNPIDNYVDTRLVVYFWPEDDVMPDGGVHCKVWYQTVDMDPFTALTDPAASINANHEHANTGPFLKVQVVRTYDHIVVYGGILPCDHFKDYPSDYIDITESMTFNEQTNFELRITTTDTGNYEPQSMTLTLEVN